ncbi:MAG: TolC family protein [Bacteroidota bacterium]
MQKTKYLSALLLTLSFWVSAQENNKWTLEECIEYAFENNITVKQSELDVEDADIGKSEAIGNYLPSVNVNMNNAWVSGLTQNVTTGVLEEQVNRNFSANLTAGVTLFDGLSNLRQFQRAKIAQLASKYNLNQIKDDIAVSIANSYLQVLVNKQTLALLKEQNQVTKEQIKLAREQINAGVIPEGDVLEIEAQDADEMQQIAVAENDVRISLISLAQTLLIKDYETFDIADDDYDIPLTDVMSKSPEEIIERAKEERYELLIAEQEVELAKKDLQLSKSQYYPSLSGFFNYNTRESNRDQIRQGGIDPDNPTQQIGVVESTGDVVVAPNFVAEASSPDPFFTQIQNNDGYTVGIQLDIPIFNGLSVRNQVARSKIGVRRAEYQEEQTELDLESNVYQAYVDAQGAAKAYDAAVKAVEAQETAFYYAQERFEVGMSNSFEFTQSKFRLTNAENNLIQAKYDFIFKIKVLELFFGIRPVEY